MEQVQRDELREMISKLETIPCPEYGGIKLPSFIPFRTKGVEKAVKDIMNLPSKDSDILICTYPKSGTHWTYEIVQMLLNKTTVLAKEAKSNTMLEIVPDLKLIEDLPPPRVLDTHFPFPFLPQNHIKEGRKIIHVIRNPKDVLVSYYYHSQHDFFLDMVLPWEEYFEAFMDRNRVAYGTWFDYELGFEQAEKDHPGMIYTCYYEDRKHNTEEEIKKIAKFLNIDYTDELVNAIARETSFENMQKNKFDVTSVIFDKAFIYRKGEVGDWKNHFTDDQNARFDAQFKEKMKNSKYKIKFE